MFIPSCHIGLSGVSSFKAEVRDAGWRNVLYIIERYWGGLRMGMLDISDLNKAAMLHNGLKNLRIIEIELRWGSC